MPGKDKCGEGLDDGTDRVNWLCDVSRELNEHRVRLAYELAVAQEQRQRLIEEAREAARELRSKREAEDRRAEEEAKRRK